MQCSLKIIDKQYKYSTPRIKKQEIGGRFMKHLLAVDVGNTQTVAGFYQDDTLLRYWRLSSSRDKTEDELFALLAELLREIDKTPKMINEIILASVVPPLTAIWTEMCQKYLNAKPLIIDSDSDLGIEIAIDNPKEAGADRLINAVAAYQAYHQAIIIVDFGTATTLDCVSPNGAYLGGAIAPGVEISKDALFARAARLATVPLAKPQSAIGKNTAQSLQAGILFGFAGQVDGLIRRMTLELPAPVRVIATGGLAPLIAPYSLFIDEVDPLLTLKGLVIVNERYAKNRQS